MKAYGILGAVVFIQAYFLNNIEIYGINPQFSWLVFVLLSFYFKPHLLPLIGTIFGWTLAILTGDNIFLNTVFGLVIGLSLSVVIFLPWWSLNWIRSLAALLSVCLLEIIIALKSGGIHAEAWMILLVFTLVHLTSAFFISLLIYEPKHE